MLVVQLSCSSDKDTTPPPPPRLDPVASPTGNAQIAIEGTAEPGSTILLAGADGFDPANITADPFTARFRVNVTLAADKTNELTFSAKDASGNESAPTHLTVEHETGHNHPKTLDVTIYVNDSESAATDPIRLSAGDKLSVKSVVKDAAGHELDRAVAVSTNIPSAFVAGPEVSNLHVAGTFSIAASVVDASLSVSRAVTVQPGPAQELALELPVTQTRAGSVVRISAAAKDAYGNVIPMTEIALSTEPPLTASYKPACSSQSYQQGFLDSSRFVAYDLSAVAANGYQFTLKASSGALEASASLKIEPQVAARFAPRNPADCTQGDLLVFTDSTWSQTLTEPVTVSTGDSLYYRYAVVDGYGNRTTTPVKVVTSSPSGQIIDDGVSGTGQIAQLSSAGSYQLSAYVSGVAAPATKAFAVDVGSAQTATVYVSSTVVSPGENVYAFATIKDAFGNVVQCPSGAVQSSLLDINVTPSGSVTPGATICSEGVFQRSFVFDGNGTYTVTASYAGATPVVGSAFVTVLGIDGTPPSVSIDNLRVDGSACTPSGAPPACAVQRGSTVEFDLTADDNNALSELEYSAFFQTTGTLRTRTVLESSNTPLPATVHFSFTVPNGVLPEDVPLVGMAIDGAGNRASTPQVVLRVGVFGTFGRAVSVVASAGLINGPTDIAFNPAGDMFIANDGNQNLLEIAHGATAPTQFSSYNRASRYIAVDGSGNVYLTDATRVSRVDATGANVVTYINLSGGLSEGLGLDGATFAKGSVDASSSSDGAFVSIAGQAFELDVSADGCMPARVCVTLAGNTKNQALAAAIAAQSSSVQATFDAMDNKVVLAAKSSGEAGNALTLSATGMTVSGATLTQGHGEELFIGQTLDNNIYRMPLDISSLPGSSASNHGAFNVAHAQRAVAIKDMSSASALAARDLYLYFIDDQNSNALRAYHAQDSVAPASVFSLTSGAGQSFDTLYDLALQPTLPAPASNPVNGCLLVTDQAQGRIYAIDTRTPSATGPTVTQVATGLSAPSGLAFYNGDLYVADRSLDAILRFGPSSDANDCF